MKLVWREDGVAGPSHLVHVLFHNKEDILIVLEAMQMNVGGASSILRNKRQWCERGK